MPKLMSFLGWEYNNKISNKEINRDKNKLQQWSIKMKITLKTKMKMMNGWKSQNDNSYYSIRIEKNNNK